MRDVSILIVDDNEGDRYLLKRHLEPIKEVKQVYEAANGREAIQFFEDYDENLAKFGEGYPPVLVFLDINMPLMNGWEFLEAFGELRSRISVEATVVVMITSSELESDRQKAQEFGFISDFAIKGQVDSERIAEIIRHAAAELSHSPEDA